MTSRILLSELLNWRGAFQAMDRAIVSRKGRRLKLCLAVFGLVIAVAFGIYSGINPRVESPAEIRAGEALIVLCPGSLLFAFFIDAEAWTNGFFFMWLVVALINLGLYGAIGAIIGRFLWKSD